MKSLWFMLSQLKKRYICILAICMLLSISFLTIMIKLLRIGCYQYDMKMTFNCMLPTQFRHDDNQVEYELSQHPVQLKLLFEFTSIAYDLDVEVILIEPLILFHLLTNPEQFMLQERGFNLTSYDPSSQVIAFGVWEKHWKRILQNDFQGNMLINGFYYTYPYNTGSYISPYEINSRGHHFFTKDDWTVHLVEFINKTNYVFYSALPNNSSLFLPNKNYLHFIDSNGIFESFVGVPTYENGKIILPSEPMRFLHQIKSSKFLDCPAILKSKKKNPQQAKILSAIKEIKHLLHPHFMDFWLTSGTLLGWYRECGIIPYTTDVDFGAWATDVRTKESLLQIFRKDNALKVKTMFGLVEEGLELSLNYKGLKADLFFFYDEGNQTYVACHFVSSNSYIKVIYPKFSLCSAVLLGQKVLVPCETEKMLITEYGPGWREPVSVWDWKSSFFNKGPEIHWEKSKKGKVFQRFRN